MLSAETRSEGETQLHSLQPQNQKKKKKNAFRGIKESKNQTPETRKLKYKTKTEMRRRRTDRESEKERAETGANNKLWSQPPEKVFRGESRCGQGERRRGEKEEEEERSSFTRLTYSPPCTSLTPAICFATPVLPRMLQIPSNIQCMLSWQK